MNAWNVWIVGGKHDRSLLSRLEFTFHRHDSYWESSSLHQRVKVEAGKWFTICGVVDAKIVEWTPINLRFILMQIEVLINFVNDQFLSISSDEKGSTKRATKGSCSRVRSDWGSPETGFPSSFHHLIDVCTESGWRLYLPNLKPPSLLCGGCELKFLVLLIFIRIKLPEMLCCLLFIQSGSFFILHRNITDLLSVVRTRLRLQQFFLEFSNYCNADLFSTENDRLDRKLFEFWQNFPNEETCLRRNQILLTNLLA